jgi:multicomponent Na+:H+ antiporter subunit B
LGWSFVNAEKELKDRQGNHFRLVLFRRVLYGVASVVLFAFLVLSWAQGGGGAHVLRVAEESGVPNAVAALYLRNRLYDTLFEVVVFSVAVLGVAFFLDGKERAGALKALRDAPLLAMARGAAFFAFLLAALFAFYGHLSPGGGFAAGVAGGTALVLVSLTPERERLERLFPRAVQVKGEKCVLLLFLVLSALACGGVLLPAGTYGSVLSGGWNPLLNGMITLKGAPGTWVLGMRFLDSEWLF